MSDKQISMDDFMADSQGRLVPKNLVSEIDKTRDALVRELVNTARDLQKRMRGFKTRAMGDVQAFVDLSAEKYSVNLGGKKGNVNLVSFDGKFKVQVAVSEHLSFDERLQAAKKLIDECITDWTEDSRAEIKALINDAFQVDKMGRINTARILGLRRLEIRDERWETAMQAIGDSLQVVGSKSYFRAYERSGDGRWRQIALDMATL